MNKYIYTILVFVFPLFAYAQDVEGVEIDSVMTYAQVVAKFGQPDEVKVRHADFPENSNIYSYFYGENKLVFSDLDGLIEYRIYDDRFKLIVNYLEGGLRVGDLLSKIQDVNVKGPLYKYGTESDGREIYHLFSQTDCPLWIRTKNGVIADMWLLIPM